MLPFAIATLFAVGGFAYQTSSLNFPFPESSRPQPFEVSVDPQFINQTIQKVRLYRPSIPIKQYPEWEDGPPPSDVNAIADYWANEYDWSTIQDQINSNFSHYTTTVPGQRDYNHPIPLHFIHERSSSEDAIPLLMLHGWPSTHLEWSSVVHPLAHPKSTSASTPSFHVVAPDLPGFGFSPAAEYPGLGPREMGAAFDALMHQLGYTSYAVYSTDLGWEVGMWMAHDQASRVSAHITDFFFATPNATDLERFAKNETMPRETSYIQGLNAYQTDDFGYANVQSTRPLALALAMTDSPVGFAAWVWQVMHTASDGFEYSNEDLVTTAMMLWIQGTYGNLRTYKEFLKPGVQNYPKTTIPTGVIQWANPNGPYANLKEFPLAPRDWIERSVNLTYFVRHEFGGHFPAISQSKLWLKNVRAFFAESQ